MGGGKNAAINGVGMDDAVDIRMACIKGRMKGLFTGRFDLSFVF
jgi:hypothetical protein